MSGEGDPALPRDQAATRDPALPRDQAVPRDPALLPGPTAAQVQARASLALYAGIAVGIAGVICLVARISFVVVVVAGLLFLAGFIAWLVIGARSQAAMKREMAAGYSTTVDAAGYDLRHPVTGALLRPRTKAPERAGRGSFLLQNLRVRPGTWAAKRIDPEIPEE